MEKKATFFVDKGGDVKWTYIAVITVIPLIIGIWILHSEIGYGIAHRFFRAGLWFFLGIAAFVFLLIKAVKYNENNADGKPAMNMIYIGWVLLFGGTLAPAIGLSGDREAGIPDARIHYANGRVLNYSDPSKETFYFKHVDVSSEDSLYILQYGEEPGYNENWSSVNGFTPSNAPRAEEGWERPKYKESK